MKKSFLSFLSCLFLEIVFSVAFAGSPYISVDGGLSYIKVGKTQQVDVNGSPVKTDTYRDQSTSKHPMTGALHFGYIFPISLKMLLALGAGIYQNGSYISQGGIEEQNDPKFYNYNYRYRLSLFRAMIEGKWLFKMTPHILPYLELGLGYANIKFSHYETIPLYPNMSIPGFADRLSSHLASQLGLGVDMKINDHLGFLVGYRYVYDGKAKSGQYQNLGASGKLETGKIFSNDVIVGINYDI